MAKTKNTEVEKLEKALNASMLVESPEALDLLIKRVKKAQEIYFAIENYLLDNGVEILFGYECTNVILEDKVCKGIYITNGKIDQTVADAALSMLDVDALGLDLMDRKLLAALLEKFSGGPVGVDNLGAAIGESTDTIEDVIEPYLIQQGYLQRTPRGRMATASIWQHFGLSAPRDGVPGQLF